MQVFVCLCVCRLIVGVVCSAAVEILRAVFWIMSNFLRCVLAALSKAIAAYSRIGRIKDL